MELRNVYSVNPLTAGENNVQIDAQLVTLSFLRLVKNWPKMRSGIWLFAVAPSNAASKNCNIGAQWYGMVY